MDGVAHGNSCGGGQIVAKREMKEGNDDKLVM